jgi:anti-anti-sigma regulatory factor
MTQPKKSSRKSGPVPSVASAPISAAVAEPNPAATPAELPAPTPAPARASVLQLGPSLSIREVGEYASRLKSMLAGGATVVDASALETIDTAGIQLLLAAAASAQDRGFKLKLLSASGVKNGAARSLGLSERLSELAEVVP